MTSGFPPEREREPPDPEESEGVADGDFTEDTVHALSHEHPERCQGPCRMAPDLDFRAQCPYFMRADHFVATIPHN